MIFHPYLPNSALPCCLHEGHGVHKRRYLLCRHLVTVPHFLVPGLIARRVPCARTAPTAPSPNMLTRTQRSRPSDSHLSRNLSLATTSALSGVILPAEAFLKGTDDPKQAIWGVDFGSRAQELLAHPKDVFCQSKQALAMGIRSLTLSHQILHNSQHPSTRGSVVGNAHELLWYHCFMCFEFIPGVRHVHVSDFCYSSCSSPASTVGPSAFGLSETAGVQCLSSAKFQAYAADVHTQKMSCLRMYHTQGLYALT